MTAPDPRRLPEAINAAIYDLIEAVHDTAQEREDGTRSHHARLHLERTIAAALASAAAPAQGVPEGFVPRSAVEPLLTALRFYARGEHYHLDDDEDFDTVSGEPDNWLMSGREGSATMVEDGRVARFALQGKPMDWIDGDDDDTPQPIEGEALAASPPPPAQEARQPDGWRPIETAPRDGTEILLTNGRVVAEGYWFHAEPYVLEKRDLEGRYIDQDESEGHDGWIDFVGGMLPDPTHWMPLPAAPGAHVTPPSEPARQGLTDEQIDALMPEADGEAEANVVKVEVQPGMWGTEFDTVDAWSRPLVRQVARAIERAHGITGAATSGAEGEGV